MSHEFLVVSALRGALLLGAALVALPLLRRAASSTRRLVAALALGAALVVPAMSSVLPAWRIHTPALPGPLHGKVTTDPVVGGVSLGVQDPGPLTAHVASPVSVTWSVDPARLAVAAWALGALLLTARMLSSLLRARSVARRASPAPGWAGARARAEGCTGVRIEVRESSEVEAPAVFGVIAPVVLVPCAAAVWDEGRKLHVLLHEAAHVRRRDGLVQVVAELAVALHWMDPLAWFCARRLRIERELAADDSAIEHGARPSSYASDLLAVAGAQPAGALGMGEPARLVSRVRAVLAKGRNRAPLGAVKTAAVVGVASSAALVLACTSPIGAAGGPAATTSPSQAAVVPAGSSIEPAIQAIAEEELDRTVREWSAAGGVAVVVDVATGRVVANAGRDHGTRADVARGRTYFPGSTMKVVTLAAALEAGLVSPSESIDCEQGAFRYHGHEIVDSRAEGMLPLRQAVAVSSNIAFAKLFDRVGGDRLEHELRALHFGVAPGSVPDRIEDHSLHGVLAAIGEGVTATPLQVAAAYVALASGGSYIEPAFDASSCTDHRERVMKPETARTVVDMLDEVVNGDAGTGKLARVDGVRVAGKTGTASWDLPGGGAGLYASFVGIVPEETPRWVILVGVEQPREGGYGGTCAAPAFSRIATRALATTKG